jgi:uncharacterized protein (TIGR00730 family)
VDPDFSPAELAKSLAPEHRQRGAAQMFATVHELLNGPASSLDLKIATAALAEMSEAFAMFAPYRHHDKVTIFGSARTTVDDPLWEHAKSAAAHLAAAGWMVVTGAGPGIMHAAMEGAGRDRSIGVSIRLPFETSANPIIAGDAKHVSMKYFFTRKLMLIKESKGFVCLPGGFGTLDEMFELLTLIQTGKGAPVPLVLLDTPGDPYWEAVDDLVRRQLVERGLVSDEDVSLYRVTDSCADAVQEITGFYRNYDSLRYVGDLLVVRVRMAPTEEQLALLNDRFAALCASGDIHAVAPLPPEVADDDCLDLPRIALRFARTDYGLLRAFIDSLNSFADDSQPDQSSAD